MKQSIKSNAENFTQDKQKNIFKTVNKRRGNGSIKSGACYNTTDKKYGSRMIPSDKDSFKRRDGGTSKNGIINLFSRKKIQKKEKNILYTLIYNFNLVS